MNPTAIRQPLNREVLLYLMTLSAVYDLAAGQNAPSEPELLTDLELRNLRTHPDLGGLLSALAQVIPDATHGYVLGFNVLVSPQGVIFAIATGMMSIAFRINPPSPQTSPLKAEGSQIETLSREWQSYSPFASTNALSWLQPLAEQALANVISFVSSQ